MEQAVKRCSHLRSLLAKIQNDPSALEIWYAKYHQKATKSTRTKKNTFNRNVEKAVETGTFRLLNVAGGLVAQTELVAALQPLGTIAAVARLVLGLDPLDEPNGARGYPALWNLLIGPIAHEKIAGIKGHKPTDHVSKYLNFKMESWYRLVAGRVLMVHANLKPARKPGKCLDAVLVQQDTQDRAEYTRMCRRVKEERVLWEHEAETTRTADLVAGDDPKARRTRRRRCRYLTKRFRTTTQKAPSATATPPPSPFQRRPLSVTTTTTRMTSYITIQETTTMTATPNATSKSQGN